MTDFTHLAPYRNPLDVIVSQFHYENRYKEKKLDFDTFFGTKCNIETFCRHYINMKNYSYLICYENWNADPSQEATKLLKFLKWRVSTPALMYALDQTDFQKEVQLERSGIIKTQYIYRGDETNRTEVDFQPFAVNGSVGQWKKFISDKQFSLIADTLTKFQIRLETEFLLE